MQSTLSSNEYCQSATRSAKSDREHGQFIRSKQDQAGGHEGRQLRPAGFSSASNEPMDGQQQCNVQFTQQLNSGDFKHLDINQTGKAIQVRSKIKFNSPTSAVIIDGTCRKLLIESFKRMGSNWGSRSGKIRNLRQLERFKKSQMALRAQKHSISYLEQDSVGSIGVVNQQGTGAKSGQGSQRRRREVVQSNSSGPKRKKLEMEESSGLPFAKRTSINVAFQNGGRISAQRSSLQRRLGNKDRLNECLSSRTGQQESAAIPRIQVQGEELILYSNVFRAQTCPSDFLQNNETHNVVHSINSTDQKRVVLRRSGVSSSIKRGFSLVSTLNLGNISKVKMASISGKVCLNSDSAIRVSRTVHQHQHESDMHDSDQESRATVTNFEIKNNDERITYGYIIPRESMTERRAPILEKTLIDTKEKYIAIYSICAMTYLLPLSGKPIPRAYLTGIPVIITASLSPINTLSSIIHYPDRRR
ncbi:MAG: hypothetical protein EZS28_033566, partial [Streblomastix strix]